MYEVDKKDKVVVLENVPQSCVGAPEPIFLSTEFRTVLAFYLQDTPEGWDGTSVRVVSFTTERPIAIV